MTQYEFHVDPVYNVCFIWKDDDLVGWVEQDGTAHFSEGVRRLPVQDAIKAMREMEQTK
jgi:hypothetical protein